MAERGIQRTHDGVPKFDGTPELMSLYREEAVQFLMTFEHRKRYLAGPRLLKELEGTAKMSVRTMTLRDPQWVSHPRGVYTLLDHLEATIARPSLPEASRFVMRFFDNLQRKKQETMTSWITRHSEALWEASQSLRKVQKEFGAQSKPGSWYQGTPTIGSEHGGSVKSEGHHAAPRSLHSQTQVGTPFMDNGLLREDDEDEGVWQEAHHGWWDHHEGWDWSHWSHHSWKTPEFEPPSTWDTSSEIFIPEFLAGFLLLHRSGLDTQERANVLAALRGEFSVTSVGRALREQWSDEDLLRRDRLKGGSAMVAEDDEAELEALMADDHSDVLEGMDAEAKEAYWSEQERIEEAMAAITAQKTTLKEARWKQKQLKLGRGYFAPKPFPARTAESSKKCFKCGGPHLMAQCPQRAQHAKVAHEEAAEIAFTTFEEAGLLGEECYEAISTEQALEGCMGIIDSGATSSLGSVEALEKIMLNNIQQSGDSKMAIDLQRRPTFKFGNGQKKDCLSTVTVGVGAGCKEGHMEIHVHDTPGQPVLVSRKALKALGAVIDFGESKAIYTKVDPSQVVPLKEAENGHLLMPITGNILAGATKRGAPFLSLDCE